MCWYLVLLTFSNMDLMQVSRTDQFGQRGIGYEFSRKAKDDRHDGTEESPVHVVVQSQKGIHSFMSI